MAYPTSDSGYFTITSLSFSPGVIAVGESVSLSITIKNISGKSISSCYIVLSGSYPSTDAPNGYGSIGYYYLHGGPNWAMSSISWGSNVSKTFTLTFPFQQGYYAVNESYYLFPVSSAKLHLSITTNATFANGTNYDNFSNLRGTSGEYLAILSKRDNPRLSFAVERTPNDESVNIKTSIRLTSDVSSSVFTSRGYSAKLYRSSAHIPATTSDTVTSLSATISQMLSGVTDSTSAITTTFSNGSDWSFLLVVTNGYETRSASASIPRAFANLHLSGCSTGGACFGGFSKSAEGTPMLESYYPAYLYGGIALANGGVEELVLPFDDGAIFKLREDNPLQPTLRRFGHVIELHGEIQPTQSISGSTTYYPICTLPAEYAPHHEVIVLQQGSDRSIWMLRIFRRDHADYPCKVMFSRYRSGSSWASAATTAWLPFHATWIV